MATAPAAPLDDAPRADGHGRGLDDGDDGTAPRPLTLDDLADAVAEGLRRAGVGPPLRLLTLDDVAARLAVSPRTVERIVTAGDLLPLWIEGQRRFTAEAVAAFVRACPAGNVKHRKHAAHRRAKPRAR